MEEINKTNQEIEKPELSKDGKEKLSKQRDEKVQEARNLDREIAEFPPDSGASAPRAVHAHA